MKDTKKVIKEVDASWKSFWKKRGYLRPFEVSKTVVGRFDLPSNIKSWSQ